MKYRSYIIILSLQGVFKKWSSYEDAKLRTDCKIIVGEAFKRRPLWRRTYVYFVPFELRHNLMVCIFNARKYLKASKVFFKKVFNITKKAYVAA